MALNITGDVQLTNGLTLSSVYGRTQYRVNDSSSEVIISTSYYVDEAAYTQNKMSLTTNLYVDGRYAYDRDVDGIDVLDFTNQKIKAELEDLGYSVVITEV